MEREATVVPGTQRVFFALWPDDEVRAALALAARRMHRVLHGRRTRDESIHLTLAFVGEVDIESFGRLMALPADVLTPRFRLTLDRWDCWPRNRIGWAAPSHIPVPLRQLAENLAAWLRDGGFDAERIEFTPHVTLLRDAQYAAMPEPLAPIEWQVEDFVLVRSELLPKGAHYEIVARWRLD
jgi:2'-5' RNA ligase